MQPSPITLPPPAAAPFPHQAKSAATQDGVARREPVKRRTKKEGVAVRMESDDEDPALEERMAQKVGVQSLVLSAPHVYVR
jgi:hypothetical protein